MSHLDNRCAHCGGDIVNKGDEPRCLQCDRPPVHVVASGLGDSDICQSCEFYRYEEYSSWCLNKACPSMIPRNARPPYRAPIETKNNR